MKRHSFKFVLCALLFLYGCTAQQHLQRAHRQQEKAIKKGAVLTQITDTLYIDNFTFDTIVKNDTVFIYKTVTQTIREAGEVRYITRLDKRIERRIKRKLIRMNHRQKMRGLTQDGKTDRTTIRNENGGRWSWWIIAILVAVFATYLIITNRKS